MIQSEQNIYLSPTESERQVSEVAPSRPRATGLVITGIVEPFTLIRFPSGVFKQSSIR